MTAIYRCPSCEHYFRIDDWSEDNDICQQCLTEMENLDV